MFFSYGTMLLNVVIIYLTALLFGLEVRGEIQLYLSYKIIVGSISSFGLSTSYLYFSKENKKFISPIYIFLIVSITASFILYVTQSYTHDVKFDYLFLIVLIEALNITVLELMKKEINLRAYFKGLFIGQLLTFTLFLLFVFIDIDSSYLINAYIIGGGGQLIYLLIKLYRYYGLKTLLHTDENLPLAKSTEYYYYLGGIGFSTMLAVLIINFDKIYVAKYLSMSELGVYSIIGSVMMIVNRFFNVLAINYFSKRINNKGTIFKVKYLYLVPFIIVLSSLSYYIAPPLLSLVLSNEFNETGFVIAALLAASLLSGINAIVLQDFNVLGKPHYNIPRQAITFIVLIISLKALNFLAIEGVALAILLTSIFRLVSSEILRKKITYA